MTGSSPKNSHPIRPFVSAEAVVSGERVPLRGGFQDLQLQLVFLRLGFQVSCQRLEDDPFGCEMAHIHQDQPGLYCLPCLMVLEIPGDVAVGSPGDRKVHQASAASGAEGDSVDLPGGGSHDAKVRTAEDFPKPLHELIEADRTAQVPDLSHPPVPSLSLPPGIHFQGGGVPKIQELCQLIIGAFPGYIQVGVGDHEGDVVPDGLGQEVSRVLVQTNLGEGLEKERVVCDQALAPLLFGLGEGSGIWIQGDEHSPYRHAGISHLEPASVPGFRVSKGRVCVQPCQEVFYSYHITRARPKRRGALLPEHPS